MSFSNNQQAAHFTNLKVLVKEAIRHKCWIYNKHKKEWFTPEEFLSRFEHSTYTQGWIESFQILNPMAGLKAAETQAQKLNEKKLAFQAKVFEYYLNKSK